MSKEQVKQVELLKKMYEFNADLLSLSEEELQIFCANNDRLIQNLKDALSS